MSTRCSIVLKEDGEEKIWLYNHHDGYIEGRGYDLTTVLRKMYEENRNNVFYWDEIANRLVKREREGGYEITTGKHGDIEFLYTIEIYEKEGRLFVYDIDNKKSEILAEWDMGSFIGCF